MQLIGLAGPARSGKDTVANHLVKTHGFKQFSFSDRLYEEVSKAFRVSVEFLQDPRIKDTPREEMCLKNCFDLDFYGLFAQKKPPAVIHPLDRLSPRFILQTWGTEYRRAQDPDYWIKEADAWVQREAEYDPHCKLVNTSVRYPNECEWIRSIGGRVWHVSRPDCPVVRAHSSEVPVPFVEGDQRLVNGGTITQLWTAATMLLGSPGLEGITVVPETEEA